MGKVTGQCPQTTTFLKRKESRRGIELRSFRFPHNALPLGQTGSPFTQLLNSFCTERIEQCRLSHWKCSLHKLLSLSLLLDCLLINLTTKLVQHKAKYQKAGPKQLKLPWFCSGIKPVQVQCYFTSTETVRTIHLDQEPWTITSISTQFRAVAYKTVPTTYIPSVSRFGLAVRR